MMKLNKGSNKKIKKEAKEILEEKVIINPPNDIPYLHFNEQLYMQKAKIEMDRRTGGDDGFLAAVTCIFIIPIFYRFFRTPYRISKQREIAYKIYLEESKAFRKKHAKEPKGPKESNKYKFELHYCSKK